MRDIGRETERVHAQDMRTPLHDAAAAGRADSIGALIDAKAHVNASDKVRRLRGTCVPVYLYPYIVEQNIRIS